MNKARRIWTVGGGRDYAGKPRPVVIVQDDSFDATDSITVCAFTTDETEAPLFHLPIGPNDRKTSHHKKGSR
jgi:mRNA interferase MazF